jgi:hypothetical protein
MIRSAYRRRRLASELLQLAVLALFLLVLLWLI